MLFENGAMDEMRQQRAHLEFLELMLPKVSDHLDRTEIESDIKKVKENIARLEQWEKDNEKFKTQTGPITNGDVRLDYPFSHQPNHATPEPGAIRPEDQ